MKKLAYSFAIILFMFFAFSGTHLLHNSKASTLKQEWQAIEIISAPHNLHRLQISNADNFSKLTYRGGLHLKSNAQDFGGFSGLHISEDGTEIIALTDRGKILQATLDYSTNGTLSGISQARIAALTNSNGAPLTGLYRDSEGLHVTGNNVLISFERKPRIDHYQVSQAGQFQFIKTIMNFEEIQSLRSNKSLEGVSKLEDGTILATIEYGLKQTLPHNPEKEIAVNGIHIDDQQRTFFSIEPTPPYAITDIDAFDNKLYILERYFSRKQGLQIRISTSSSGVLSSHHSLPTTQLAEFTLLQDIDNFEGISVRSTQDDRTFIYIISDDNFSTRQKTLLMMFELDQNSTNL